MATRSQSTSSDEREFLGSFVKDQKKYGSTASHKTERFTTHYVQPEDTLQGLALKYGVTVISIYMKVSSMNTNSFAQIELTFSFRFAQIHDLIKDGTYKACQ